MACKHGFMVSELFIHNLPANVKDFDVERALRECKDSASGIFVASVRSEGSDHRITRIAFSSNVDAENALRHRIFRITDVQPEVEFEVTSTPPEDQPPSLLKTTLGRLATLLPIVFSAFDWDDCLQPSEPTLSKTIENPLPDTKGIQADIPCHLEGEVVNELDNHADLDAARIESAYVQLQAKHHQTMDALKRAEANAKMYRGKYYLRRKECLSDMRSQKTFRSHRPPSRIRSSRKPSNDQRIREDEEARTLVSFIRLLEEVEDTRVEINPKSDQLQEMAAEAKEKVRQALLDNKVLRAKMREHDAAEETRRANETEMQAVIKSLRESQVTTQTALEGAHLNAQNLESDLRKAKTRAQGAFNRLRKLKSMYSQLDTRATEEARRVKNDVQILEGERTAWRGECLILKSQSDILRLQLLMSAKNLDILRAELEQANRTANIAAEQKKKIGGERDELQKRLDEELCKAHKARNVRDVLRAELEQTNRTANLAVTQKQEMRGERDELQKRLDEELCKALKDRDVHRAELEQANRTASLAVEQKQEMRGERDELQKRLDEELCKARKDRDVHRAELEQANGTASLAVEQQEKMRGEHDELQKRLDEELCMARKARKVREVLRAELEQTNRTANLAVAQKQEMRGERDELQKRLDDELCKARKDRDVHRAELEQANGTASLAVEQTQELRGERDELQKRLDDELCKARKDRDVHRADLEQANRTASLALEQQQKMRGERDELQKRLDEELCKARKDRDVHRAELEQANRTASLALEQQQKMTEECDELQTYKSWAEPTLVEKNQAIQDLRGQFDESRLEASLLNTRVDLLETQNGELREELQAGKNREQKTQAEELKRVRELHQCRIQLQAMEGLKNSLRAEFNESQRTVLDFRLREAAFLVREEETQRAHKDALDECHRRIRALQAEIDAKDEAGRQRHKTRPQQEPFTGTSHSEGDTNAKRKTPEQSQEERRSQWKKAAQTEKERCRQRDSQWTSGSDEWTSAKAVQRFRSVLAEFETMTFSEARPLTFEAIPWPVLHRPGVFSVQQVDWAAVEGFCKHLKLESGDGYKAFFKRIQVTFHPDKWRSRNILSTVMEEGLRKELEAAGSIVAQQVNGCL